MSRLNDPTMGEKEVLQDSKVINTELAGKGGQIMPRRVIVVRSESLAARIKEILRRHSIGAAVEIVPSYLSAMGEVALKPSDMIVGPLDAILPIMKSTVQSLRRLSPQTRLLVLASEHNESDIQAAVEAGINACLVEPVDDRHLAEAMAIVSNDKQAQPDNATVSMQIQTNDAAVAVESSDVQQVADIDLGDIDLVELLLHDHNRLNTLAMKIVAARSGIEGISFSPVGEDSPHGHYAATVAYQGQVYGEIHTDLPVGGKQLSAWAAWLARWLALGRHMKVLEEQAMRDELTGVWNRRYFNQFLVQTIGRATVDRSQVTLLIFDIDDFKRYNDRYGHAAGDEILRATAHLMQSVVRDHDVVARIGGDEFAVIFWEYEAPRKPNSRHPKDVMMAAERFRQAICEHRFPKLLDEARGTLTISGGLASFPWDGRSPEELMAQADAMLMKSKRQGKNVIMFGPSALKYCENSD